MSHRSFLLVFAFLLALSSADAPAGAGTTPLLIEGKRSLYQRVLTRPNARLVERAGGSGGKRQPAFSRFYVYARKRLGDAEWLEVGRNLRGDRLGWIAAAMTVPWKQQLALAFTNPAGRERTLLFADRVALETILESDEPARLAVELRKRVETGGSDPRILSIEPATHVDINQRFYLLPILESEEIYTGTGRTVRVLEVASVTRQDGSESQSGASPPTSVRLLSSFKAAVVFVIDSTISMGPYIDRTRAAVRRIYDRIEEAGLLEQVKFGLFAYRSNVGATPGLEYVARQYVDPSQVRDGEDFLRRVSRLKPASVSSARFDEDAYAGLMAALNQVRWTDFGARYIVLVTDAGALEGRDGLSRTGLDAPQVRLEAQHRGVAVYVMHLKTPEGRENHASAEGQYRDLSAHPLLTRPLYYPVDAGSVPRFGEIVDALGDAIVDQVKAAARGDKVVGSAKTADPDYGRNTPADDPRERIREEVRLLGHAMQLAFLGRERGTAAPPVFKAWIADVALEDATRRTVEVRVLLTKNQLSDMRLVLQGIVDAANTGLTSPDSFYASLRSFASTLGRDPNRVTDPAATRLGDLGLLGEYLEDLPYKSDVMNLDQEIWSRWSVQQQLAFINRVNRKLRLYEIYNSDVDRWVSLADGSDPGEYVYPVPLDALP